MTMDFGDFFGCAYERRGDPQFSPFEYQRRLAEEPLPDVLEIPTGLGKTAAVVLAWLWKRGWRADGLRASPMANTPRRLVYCLPMRVLVEQTQAQCERWLSKLGVLGEAGAGRVSVHVLMGGSEDLKKAVWAEHPEEDQIIIGTQDMLLSRALMRGYGMSRYQWPVHFAWLHDDALWVFDEVQLMGPGLVTSAQLEAFRRDRPGTKSRSLWVSATFRADWMRTVDFDSSALDIRILNSDEKASPAVRDRRESVKPLRKADFAMSGTSKPEMQKYFAEFSRQIAERHKDGTATLAIVNTVERAQGLLKQLDERYDGANSSANPEFLLVHSRFRAAERAMLNARLAERPPSDGPGRIIVATQAVEAGVDLSARVLFTELAPWASMVQRFGRCNRYGECDKTDERGEKTGDAQVLWVDVAETPPYAATELEESRSKLKSLMSASPAALPAVTAAAPLHPVLRRKDFLDLFSTEADLSGFDVDIAPYIRDADDADVLLFWRDIPADVKSLDEPAPAPEELCRAGLGAARDLLKKLAKMAGNNVWQWNTREREWERITNLQSPRLRPGMTLMVRAACGGYSERYGLDVDGLDAEIKKHGSTSLRPSIDAADAEALEDDHRSLLSRAIPLDRHLADVAEAAAELCTALNVPNTDGDGKAVVTAAGWHDLGKAHEAFTSMIREAHKKGTGTELGPGFWAKSGREADPETGQPRKIGRVAYQVQGEKEPRKRFRHELASMLGWLEHHDGEPHADLIAYLIAAHHGKVRMSLRAWPGETEPDDPKRLFARGVWAGDVLPALHLPGGESLPETELRLDLMQLGEGAQGPSWTTRTQRLLKDYGPFRLAFLEALVRVADWRASRREQEAGENV
jgi:CRISPR-associated endonuclease/helicase Cas3